MAQPARIDRATQPSYVCKPGPRSIGETLAELWEFRGLVRVFVVRDLRLRYRNTVLGAAWNLLQPLGYLAVFCLVCRGVGGSGAPGDAPYPLFLYPGLLLWQLLSRILALGASSVDAFRPLLCRVFFPRLIAPLTAVTGALVDFGVGCSALAVVAIGYGVRPGWHLLYAPLCVALILVLGLGLSLWLTAASSARGSRDLRQALPFLTQMWLFASPVVYPLARVPPELRAVYQLNPMVAALEGFRFALVPGAPAPAIPA